MYMPYLYESKYMFKYINTSFIKEMFRYMFILQTLHILNSQCK